LLRKMVCGFADKAKKYKWLISDANESKLIRNISPRSVNEKMSTTVSSMDKQTNSRARTGERLSKRLYLIKII